MGAMVPRFVKWAGGKNQLIEQFKPFFPTKIERYIEPFVGSGAVFFYVVQTYEPKYVLLADINEELINAYVVIRDAVEKLITLLKQHKREHEKDPKKHYYAMRAIKPVKLDRVKRAARFIYLNRTCFNGLYRVNSENQFNVPMGSYKNPDVVQEEKLRRISALLRGVELKVMSFEKVLNYAKKGDFIYLDPPYYPLKNGLSFTSYTKDAFLGEEQKQLKKVFSVLSRKGCLCMESNSDTDFIKKLFSDFKIHHVSARRLINSKKEGRGAISEVVITNY